MKGLLLCFMPPAGFLTWCLWIALKRRVPNKLFRIPLVLTIFWLPAISITSLLRKKTNQAWEEMILTMIWQAMLLILGLCLMYGSKRIHDVGREMVYFCIVAIALLLSAMVISF